MSSFVNQFVTNFFRGIDDIAQSVFSPSHREAYTPSSHDVAWEKMNAKYPDQKIPEADTLKIFAGFNVEEIQAKGVTMDHLRRIAFMATYYTECEADYLPPEMAERATKNYAANLLKNALRQSEGQAA